jgi:hypothetical protein
LAKEEGKRVMKFFKNEIPVNVSLENCYASLPVRLLARNCTFKNMLSKSILLTTVTFLFCVSTYSEISQAKSVMLSQDECQALTTTDKTYTFGVQRIMKLSAVKTWIILLDKNSRRLAIGANVDKPVFKGGRCFWSVSLYESDESKLQLWREYLVEINGSQIFIAK